MTGISRDFASAFAFNPGGSGTSDLPARIRFCQSGDCEGPYHQAVLSTKDGRFALSSEPRGTHGENQNFEQGSGDSCPPAVSIAIVPTGEDGWAAVTTARVRAACPLCARRIEQIQKQLRGIYVLAED
jgi:hypothetical protein